jgi:hypothetical protein
MQHMGDALLYRGLLEWGRAAPRAAQPNNIHSLDAAVACTSLHIWDGTRLAFHNCCGLDPCSLTMTARKF